MIVNGCIFIISFCISSIVIRNFLNRYLQAHGGPSDPQCWHIQELRAPHFCAADYLERIQRDYLAMLEVRQPIDKTITSTSIREKVEQK